MFIIIAVYVGSVVTANTFATIIAGRTRTIALLRLIGSSARAQRRSVAREGLAVGLIGAGLGALLGSLTTFAAVTIAVGAEVIPSLEYAHLLGGDGGRNGASCEETTGKRGRNAIAITFFVFGGVLLSLGILLGLVSPFGVLVGLIGGLFSFTGLVLGAGLIMPPALRLVGRMFGSSAPARLAAENAVRYPERSSRTTIGLVIGVTLVTMFAVAMESYEVLLRAAWGAEPEYYTGIGEMFTMTIVVFSALIGFSALIAAVGMVNNLSLSVLQRTRELGLLRALRFTPRQVRRMILAESAQLTLAAVLVGLVLGISYGWAGAQSMFGSINGSPGLVAPAVPIEIVVVEAVAASLLTAVASIAPSRRATRVAPVAALAVQ